MRKLTLLVSALFVFGVVFLQCSKKTNPTPAPTTSSSGPGAATTANTLLISGQTTETLTVTGSTYSLTGESSTAPSTGNVIDIGFSTVPTNGTVTLGFTQSNPSI